MWPFADPYAVFSGALLCLLGISIVLSLLLKKQPLLAWPLSAVFGVSAALWLGILLLDVSRFYAVDLRPNSINARWILFPAAIILLATGAVITGVYGEHTGAPHAVEYRRSVWLIVAASALCLFGFFLQPLFA